MLFQAGSGVGNHLAMSAGMGVANRTDSIAMLCFFRPDQVDQNFSLFSCGGGFQNWKLTFNATSGVLRCQTASTHEFSNFSLADSDRDKWFCFGFSTLGHTNDIVGFLRRISDQAATVAQTLPTQTVVAASAGAAYIGRHSTVAQHFTGTISHCVVLDQFTTNMTVGQFDAIVDQILADGTLPAPFGDSRLLFWDSVSGITDTPVNSELSGGALEAWDAEQGGVTLTPVQGAGVAKAPIVDVPIQFRFLRGGQRSGQGLRLASGAGTRPSGRRMPYPFRGALGFFHDNHSLLDKPQFLDLLKWMTTRQFVSPYGPGLGLDFSSSIWFSVNDDFDAASGQFNKLSIAQPAAAFTTTESGDADDLYQLMADGLIDSWHGFGDFGTGADYRMSFASANATSIINALAARGVAFLRNTINHGSGNPTNIGVGQGGDDDGPPPNAGYHTDQTVDGVNPNVSGRLRYGWLSTLQQALVSCAYSYDEHSPALRATPLADGRVIYDYPRSSPNLMIKQAAGGVYTAANQQLVVPDDQVTGWVKAAGDAVLITSTDGGQQGVAAIVGTPSSVGGFTTITLSSTLQYGGTLSDDTNVTFDIWRVDFASPNQLWSLRYHGDADILDLIETGRVSAIYCHLESYSPQHLGQPAINAFIGYDPAIRDQSIAALQSIAARYRSGRIWVAAQVRLLDYLMMLNQARWEAGKAVINGQTVYTININASFTDDDTGLATTVTAKQCEGLTFYQDPAAPDADYRITLNGADLGAVKYPADETGRASFGVPIRRASSTLVGGGGRFPMAPLGAANPHSCSTRL